MGSIADFQRAILCMNGESIEDTLISTPLELYDSKISSNIKADGDMCVVKISGNNTIESGTPISTCNCNKLVIKGSGTLELIATEAMQPCIGPKTVTGLSNGRWSVMGNPPNEIIVDGAKVICHGCVDNFTIGRYGRNALPKIVVKNGGELICPEMRGIRTIERRAETVYGSDKQYGEVIYNIV